MHNNQVLNDRYQLIEVLGHGGMADIYLAWDKILKRYAAIKILRLDLQNDEDAKRRFKHEASAIAELNSPYIVKVYDFGEQGDLQYLVMEYVKGTNLKRYIKEHYPLSNRKIIKIMEQITKAVMTAHHMGIIHRDLKPQNVLIDEHGDAKISDFGISITASDKTITRSNYVVGSIHYLSPEQITGHRATEKSDIYSLGIIMFELLTDTVPFDGDNAVTIALAHTRGILPNITKYNSKATQGLINIVTKATDKNPNGRYSSVKEMLFDIEHNALRNDVRPYVLKRKDEETDGADETKIVDLTSLNKNVEQKHPNLLKNYPAHSKHPFVNLYLSIIIVVIYGLFVIGYYLIMNTTVPNVDNFSYHSALTKLKRNHIKVHRVIYEDNGNVDRKHVIKTNPISKKKVNRIWGVDLVLSTGHGSASLGNFIGQNAHKVATSLRKKGFKVVFKRASSDYFKRGLILKQNFDPERKYDSRDKKIVLTESIGFHQFTMRNLVGQTKEEAQSYVDQVGLNPTYEYRYQSDQKTNTVIQQNPNSGLKVYSGDNIIIVIATNNDKTNQNNNVNLNLNIPYLNNGTGYNLINIYIGDRDHNINRIYRQLKIYQDSKVILPFHIDANNKGQYQIFRDGKKIMDVKSIQ